MVRSIVSLAPAIVVNAIHEAAYLGLTYACISAVTACLAILRDS